MGYEYYEEYEDENISYIDADKFITLHPKQINLTQETNSQYIPFQMNRYYDGFDLSTVTLQIYYINKLKQFDVVSPVNVLYTNDEIRFAWLVDKHVTAVEGMIAFEIQAVGVNSRGDEYIWKTHPNMEMTVVKSLTGETPVVIHKTWIEDIKQEVNRYIDSKLEEINVAMSEMRNDVNGLASDSSVMRSDVNGLLSITELTADEVNELFFV